ncbi:YARHG domain-containing protein [Reichenbachiella sp.]|uniref:YARHG domain-containing protein n=1 Tax=Reichenbachiella sp. TaxID=2184521 RepID=UPI003BAF4BCE
MKKIRNNILVLLALSLVYACSETKKSQTAVVEKTPEPVVKEEKFTFQQNHVPILKEHLFFFLRENAMKMDRNTFIKHEDIQVGTTDFKYTAVIIDKGMLNRIAEIEQSRNYQYAGFFSAQQDNVIPGDSITIKGSLNITDTQQEGVEKQVSKVTVRIEAEYHSSYLQASPYGYGEYQRMGDAYDYEEDLIVDLNQPYIFNKDELFLKARISELTAQDLAGFSNDELAYLRNEIFARHGHSFKTEKMQEYFGTQSWYKAYFEDATPFLNELEKTNAQFIRSMES